MKLEQLSIGKKYLVRWLGTEVEVTLTRLSSGYIGETSYPLICHAVDAKGERGRFLAADFVSLAPTADVRTATVNDLVARFGTGDREAALELRRRLTSKVLSLPEREVVTGAIRTAAVRAGWTEKAPETPKPVVKAVPTPKSPDALPLMRKLAGPEIQSARPPLPTPALPAARSSPQEKVSAPAKTTLGKVLGEALKPSQDKLCHMIVAALAGTGKTTTLVGGIVVMGGGQMSFTPSEEQEAIWVALLTGQYGPGAPTLAEALANRVYSPKTAAVCAFGKDIADEVDRRLQGTGYEGMTTHRLGLRICRNNLGLRQGKDGINQYRMRNILEELTGIPAKQFREEKRQLLSVVEELVRMAKANLLDPIPENLDRLVSFYDIEVEDEETGANVREEAFDLVERVMERAKDVSTDRCVDFSDMIWLPNVLNLPFRPYDLLLVDEWQDLNKAQQSLAMKCGRRLVLCGDRHQSIFGFAGANVEGMDEYEQRLRETERGVAVLPLTYTRRCSHAVVREAQKQVPTFRAVPENPEGVVREARYPIQYRDRDGKDAYEIPFEDSYAAEVRPGDMILCRVNAPLVRECFRFLKRGVRAQILGRSIGDGLLSLVKKLADPADPVPALVTALDEWSRNEVAIENAKANPSEGKLIAIGDKRDCVLAFTEQSRTVADVMARITSLFTDVTDDTVIRLSSIHKAKGLEARRVFFLQLRKARCPHPMAKSRWELAQEQNMLYVAKTRAIEELVYVVN